MVREIALWLKVHFVPVEDLVWFLVDTWWLKKHLQISGMHIVYIYTGRQSTLKT